MSTPRNSRVFAVIPDNREEQGVLSVPSMIILDQQPCVINIDHEHDAA